MALARYERYERYERERKRVEIEPQEKRREVWLTPTSATVLFT